MYYCLPLQASLADVAVHNVVEYAAFVMPDQKLGAYPTLVALEKAVSAIPSVAAYIKARPAQDY